MWHIVTMWFSEVNSYGKHKALVIMGNVHAMVCLQTFVINGPQWCEAVELVGWRLLAQFGHVATEPAGADGCAYLVLLGRRVHLDVQVGFLGRLTATQGYPCDTDRPVVLIPSISSNETIYWNSSGTDHLLSVVPFHKTILPPWLSLKFGSYNCPSAAITLWNGALKEGGVGDYDFHEENNLLIL